ncbi:phospholipase A [Cupriavidus pauculus]|uniref:Phospholipase A1 n=1 Tax=Cupriavidus pauculus TaxID=82633 RepID=A0A5P2H2Q2_9BURK|nr:phospholipase A [Cupriavidus pauculus]
MTVTAPSRAASVRVRPFCVPLHRALHTRSLTAAALASALLTAPLAAQAAVTLLQPPRVVDGTQPLTVTLLVVGDAETRRFEVPATLAVTASADMTAPIRVEARRVGAGPGVLQLRHGETRTIRYTAPWPDALRGQVRLDVAGIDAAPVLVTLNRAADANGAAAVAAVAPRASGPLPANGTAPEIAPAGAASADAATGPVTTVATVPAEAGPAPADLRDAQRLSFNEPMYIMFGGHNGANAKFQLSFKFRIFEGKDPASKSVLDNLYFGYTQFSLWDLSGESRPFRDTNYRPSLYYYLSDTGVRNSVISRLSVATGFEHESNGLGGDSSRGINTLFVTPTMYFGDQTDWHWRVAPKLYAYVGKSDNEDIAHYRGYMDLNIAYGKPDSWEVAATLRKGTRKGYGSVNAALTYPLARLVPGTAGYLMAGWFYGYGESLIDYNQKSPWQFRIGYALSR